MTQSGKVSALATRVGAEFKKYLKADGTAAKASADADGNKFTDYYATKSEVAALAKQVSNEDEDYGSVVGSSTDVDYGSI